jgi:tellurite resistance protein
MSANSKHVLDIYEWIKKVIMSCKNEEQLSGARKLVELYNKIDSDFGNNWNLKWVAAFKFKQITDGKEVNN